MIAFKTTAISVITLFVMITVLLPANLIAEETANTDATATALGDIKQAKGLFWLSLKDPKKTAIYLELISGTHQGFIQKGVKPDMILMFSGPMVGFLTTQPKDEIAMEYEKDLKSISKSVAKLHDLGIRMEVCGQANKIVGVDPKTLLPGLINVDDSSISLIGWQYQGYMLVPIF